MEMIFDDFLGRMVELARAADDDIQAAGMVGEACGQVSMETQCKWRMALPEVFGTEADIPHGVDERQALTAALAMAVGHTIIFRAPPTSGTHAVDFIGRLTRAAVDACRG